jgi:hypothetical protein
MAGIDQPKGGFQDSQQQGGKAHDGDEPEKPKTLVLHLRLDA